MAGLVALPPVCHLLVAVAINIVGYIRMLMLHIFVIALWDGLLPVSL